ncbi:MAG: phage distal tail protein [Clostridium sp.]
MKISDIGIDFFNAKLSEKKIGATSQNVNLVWNQNSTSPILLSSNPTFCTIDCCFIFTIEDGCEDKFNDKFSRFSKIIKECSIQFPNSRIMYKSYLDNIGVPEQITQWDWQVRIKWNGYKYSKEKVIQMKNEFTKIINTEGTMNSPCIIEINPDIDMIDLSLDGFVGGRIRIKSLSKNKTITIDGVNGTITEEGVSKFKDCDLWQFPKIHPGENEIILDKNSCEVVLKFSPRYL